ncbi:amino acid permease [Oleisolibacter albus]|uniref:amino acid permease n=1 Tax=Oleisolibacter albus TaxID=2171757 RepID=UPI000DF4620C|nr:amino acid permease [Oleisolibacter albus]
MSLFTARPLDQSQPPSGLHRRLGWPHLVALGVGAIVGTGIYTLIGVGAERAGPAIILAFAIAGAVCALSALAYAELASMIPDAGGAYAYAQTGFGEAVAWFVGWSLVLEYAVACSAVGVGWSGYIVAMLGHLGLALPTALTAGPHAGGIINLPAVCIVLLVAALLMRGVHESARWNVALVVVKLSALALFALLAFAVFSTDNLAPFTPYGLFAQEIGGETRGVMTAAAVVFFAFFGFDAVATAAEEAKRPERDVAIGIIGSIAVCTVIYMVISAAAVGAVPFTRFAGRAAPLADILILIGHPLAASVISLAAVLALPTVILVMMYGQTRVLYSIARDGLLPERLSRVDPRAGVPRLVTLLTALAVALVAGFLPLGEIAELTNAGSLTAFVAVSITVLVLRRRYPAARRGFRYPLAWLLAPLAAAGCLYLLLSLPQLTLDRFALWHGIGLLVYAANRLWRRRQAKA